MLYISGNNENISELKNKEGFEGSLASYLEKFNKLNPHLLPNPTVQSEKLPSFMPMFLVSEEPIDAFSSEEILRELSRFSLAERQKLRDMQENQYDFPTLIALTSIMEELQSYGSDFRKSLDNPLISTPWNSFNHSLTNASLMDIFSESAAFGAGLIHGSNRFKMIDKLYETMMKRDALNLELYSLRNKKDSTIYLRRTKIDLISSVYSILEVPLTLYKIP